MIAQSDDLSPLAPTPLEVGIAVLTVVDLVLLAIVVVQVLRGRLQVPHGVWGVVVLLVLPVVGPLLVLTWPGRVERRRERDGAVPRVAS